MRSDMPRPAFDQPGEPNRAPAARGDASLVGLASLLHDLTNPLQNIANNARLLMSADLDADERAAVQQTIERELATLRHLTDDVVNMARPRPLTAGPVDVNSVLAEVVDAMRAEAARVNVSVTACYGDGPLVIDADRFALGRVYRNVIANAIEATPSGGHVTVTTARTGGSVEVRVSDTGVGIPPERLASIFEEFVTTKPAGTGLGLANARHIVEQLGGSIEVSSEVGHGSRFTLRFGRHTATGTATR
jgi:signal transduction histidine kinase